MSDPTSEGNGRQPSPAPAGYEPPRVEQVLTPAALEREVLYAGDITNQDRDPG